jgi:hypothetical protein
MARVQDGIRFGLGSKEQADGHAQGTRARQSDIG